MRLPRPIFAVILVASSLAGAGAAWWADAPARSGGGSGPERGPVVPAARQTVRVTPGHQPVVSTGILDHQGEEVVVSCMTCHATRAPDREAGLAEQTPTEFHQGLHYAHGGLSCLSCHDATDYDALRRADGRLIAFPQAAQQLCTQCHGTQARDYERGAHGGMRGYWDLSKGERTRNSCTDCHDPHAPAFPAVSPVFPPRDPGARQQAMRAILHGHD